MMGDQEAISDSLVKKRARDRRAQHNLRKKRDAHVHALEQRIADLERELDGLRQGFYGLHSENETLRNRQFLIRRLVTSWTDPVPVSVIPSESLTPNTTPSTADANIPTHADDGGAASPLPGSPPAGAKETRPTTRPQRKTIEDLTSPRWSITPFHLDSDLTWSSLASVCIGNPKLVYSSPDEPKPLELLYGSKTNLLAHAVSSTTNQWRCRDPERVAAGWLAYRLIKWSLQPSEHRFSLLEDFQRPVSEQLCQAHPYFVDYVVWPRLRINLIKTLHVYDPRDVMGMLSCCMKVRWPWNETFLEPGENGEYVLRASFRETFLRLDGWGITREFLERFPLLAQDLDVNSILYNFV
ncbi:hypothetical protein F5Y14DRAFT_296193 [Nemania sp. NC0429]|nr:hypothetical protein F5Y14DRAFT_296193 [Nemania sp. NC0429]